MRGQDFFQLCDLCIELIAFSFQFDTRELCESTQAQFKNVVCLDFREIESSLEAFAGGFDVIGRTNNGNDVINVENCNEQALNQMQAITTLSKSEVAATSRDIDSMVKENSEHIFEPQRPWLAINQCNCVDREGIF